MPFASDCRDVRQRTEVAGGRAGLKLTVALKTEKRYGYIKQQCATLAFRAVPCCYATADPRRAAVVWFNLRAVGVSMHTAHCSTAAAVCGIVRAEPYGMAGSVGCRSKGSGCSGCCGSG